MKEGSFGKSIAEVLVHRVDGEAVSARQELIAIEEPLEIRLSYDDGAGYTTRSLSVTMRTPGHDVELAVGFLFNEGIIRRFEDIEAIQHSGPRTCQNNKRNVLTVVLKAGVVFEALRLERHFYTTSSCGVCGKTSIEALKMAANPVLPHYKPRLSARVLHGLADTLRVAQEVFDQTGGLHAAALFDTEGTLLRVFEDVGRHNALDKLIGSRVLEQKLPLHHRVLLVSGRTSFELTQKALMAEIPMLVAVGAPSSLAVDLARQFDMTLLGFARDGRFNVYSGSQRIEEIAPEPIDYMVDLPLLTDT